MGKTFLFLINQNLKSLNQKIILKINCFLKN